MFIIIIFIYLYNLTFCFSSFFIVEIVHYSSLFAHFYHGFSSPERRITTAASIVTLLTLMHRQDEPSVATRLQESSIPLLGIVARLPHRQHCARHKIHDYYQHGRHPFEHIIAHLGYHVHERLHILCCYSTLQNKLFSFCLFDFVFCFLLI